MRIIVTVILLSACGLLANDSSVAGVYKQSPGFYVLTLTLLENGNYLARWDADMGSNGSASGSWVLSGSKVKLTPKKEEGYLMPGYLRVLIVRQFDGHQTLLREEDLAHENNPWFQFFLHKRPNQ